MNGDGICSPFCSDPTPAEPMVNALSGDVYINEACYGVILTEPDGNCYRLKVETGGGLVTELINCP